MSTDIEANEKIITARANAFTGRGVETLKFLVKADGQVKVYDSIAGYYTTCHRMSEATMRRIRKLAQ